MEETIKCVCFHGVQSVFGVDDKQGRGAPMLYFPHISPLTAPNNAYFHIFNIQITLHLSVWPRTFNIVQHKNIQRHLKGS